MAAAARATRPHDRAIRAAAHAAAVGSTSARQDAAAACRTGSARLRARARARTEPCRVPSSRRRPPLTPQTRHACTAWLSPCAPLERLCRVDAAQAASLAPRMWGSRPACAHEPTAPRSRSPRPREAHLRCYHARAQLQCSHPCHPVTASVTPSPAINPAIPAPRLRACCAARLPTPSVPAADRPRPIRGAAIPLARRQGSRRWACAHCFANRGGVRR